jgi:uncharacterized membrane protein YkgB
MIKDFNVSEEGYGSYRLLGILRWVMVLIFISFGIQKFTPQSADGIALYISNSPFVSWLSIFGIRGEANLLGIIELMTAALLAAGAFIPILSALGSLMGIGTFAITWSFFFSTPGVVKWSVSTDPIGWNLTGEFLFKDVVFLCVCIVSGITAKESRRASLELTFRRDHEPNPWGHSPFETLTWSYFKIGAPAKELLNVRVWVKSRHRVTFASCPLYPQKRTSTGASSMSALCQKQTHAVQHKLIYAVSFSAHASARVRGNTSTARHVDVCKAAWNCCRCVRPRPARGAPRRRSLLEIRDRPSGCLSLSPE